MLATVLLHPRAAAEYVWNSRCRTVADAAFSRSLYFCHAVWLEEKCAVIGERTTSLFLFGPVHIFVPE